MRYVFRVGNSYACTIGGHLLRQNHCHTVLKYVLKETFSKLWIYTENNLKTGIINHPEFCWIDSITLHHFQRESLSVRPKYRFSGICLNLGDQPLFIFGKRPYPHYISICWSKNRIREWFSKPESFRSNQTWIISYTIRLNLSKVFLKAASLLYLQGQL